MVSDIPPQHKSGVASLKLIANGSQAPGAMTSFNVAVAQLGSISTNSHAVATEPVHSKVTDHPGTAQMVVDRFSHLLVVAFHVIVTVAPLRQTLHVVPVAVNSTVSSVGSVSPQQSTLGAHGQSAQLIGLPEPSIVTEPDVNQNAIISTPRRRTKWGRRSRRDRISEPW